MTIQVMNDVNGTSREMLRMALQSFAGKELPEMKFLKGHRQSHRENYKQVIIVAG